MIFRETIPRRFGLPLSSVFFTLFNPEGEVTKKAEEPSWHYTPNRVFVNPFLFPKEKGARRKSRL